MRAASGMYGAMLGGLKWKTVERSAEERRERPNESSVKFDAGILLPKPIVAFHRIEGRWVPTSLSKAFDEIDDAVQSLVVLMADSETAEAVAVLDLELDRMLAIARKLIACNSRTKFGGMLETYFLRLAKRFDFDLGFGGKKKNKKNRNKNRNKNQKKK